MRFYVNKFGAFCGISANVLNGVQQEVMLTLGHILHQWVSNSLTNQNARALEVDAVQKNGDIYRDPKVPTPACGYMLLISKMHIQIPYNDKITNRNTTPIYIP